MKIPDEQGKWFNPLKIILISETGNIIIPVKIQQDQSPASAVRRTGFMDYKSAIQQAQSMTAGERGDPGPAGISIPGKIYLSAMNIIFLRWQGRLSDGFFIPGRGDDKTLSRQREISDGTHYFFTCFSVE
jgi:hypothetical protein